MLRRPRLLPALAIVAITGACAPAPLYTASGAGRASVHGEIPRDSRGEPVWEMIRPAPSAKPFMTKEQADALARARAQDVPGEGSRASDPR